jgi:hypothetical protein
MVGTLKVYKLGACCATGENYVYDAGTVFQIRSGRNNFII